MEKPERIFLPTQYLANIYYWLPTMYEILWLMIWGHLEMNKIRCLTSQRLHNLEVEENLCPGNSGSERRAGWCWEFGLSVGCISPSLHPSIPSFLLPFFLPSFLPFTLSFFLLWFYSWKQCCKILPFIFLIYFYVFFNFKDVYSFCFHYFIIWPGLHIKFMNDFDFLAIIMHTQDKWEKSNLQIVFRCKDIFANVHFLVFFYFFVIFFLVEVHVIFIY